jgi:hypothetical protein
MVAENQRNICTIVAKNYVSFARTLCESFLALHPSGQCHVLFIDQIDGYIDPSKERFSAHRLDEIGLPNEREFLFQYNVTELATAVKPFFLRFLLSSQGMREILYLDPDILVLDSLEKLFDLLKTSNVVLTPHLDTDYPDDGRFPDDSHILRGGIFNLGFIGVRSGGATKRFLDWWAEKMRDKCVIDHGKGYFVDQRFIDLAFTLFDGIHVEKDTGYNVAYWNLHSRRIERNAGRWLCNGSPLYFFHFSNYRPDHPGLLSAFQDRIRLSAHPDLAELFSMYTARLLQHGYGESREYPYTHGRYSDGGNITDEDRRVYRAIGRRYVHKDPFNRSNFPLKMKLLMAGARFLGKARLIIRNRAVRKDGLTRKIAKVVYGNFPTRET